MATDAEIIDGIAAIGLSVAELNADAIYGPGTGTVAGVKELPDDIGHVLPAFMVLDGDSPIIPGSWERQTWTLRGSVWADYMPRGLRYRELLAFRGPILSAFRAKGKGGLVDTAVQSVLITEFGAIEGRKWASGDGQPTYLVLPFSIEVKVNRAVTYQPA